MRILLVEDDNRIAAPVSKGLTEEGWVVLHVRDGEAALKCIRAETFDVIILDILLPQCDGFSVLRELRDLGATTPVVMLTALGQLENKVRGLNEGADDYLVKPFAFAELLARVRALARRTRDSGQQPLRIADLTVDPLTRTVTRADKLIDLSPREYDLLEYFLRNAGRTLTRTEIAEQVWGYHHDFGTNVVDVYINYLRRKVDQKRKAKLIHTVRGVGYVLSAQPVPGSRGESE